MPRKAFQAIQTSCHLFDLHIFSTTPSRSLRDMKKEVAGRADAPSEAVSQFSSSLGPLVSPLQFLHSCPTIPSSHLYPNPLLLFFLFPGNLPNVGYVYVLCMVVSHRFELPNWEMVGIDKHSWEHGPPHPSHCATENNIAFLKPMCWTDTPFQCIYFSPNRYSSFLDSVRQR